MRTKEEILEEYFEFGKKITGAKPITGDQIKELCLAATEAYASQFSGSEPEGKEAVEFADFINKNVYVRYTINRGWHKLGKTGSYTTEQLYKIWKEGKI